MPIEVKSAAQPERNVWSGLWRGFRGRCPNCGEGHLFRSYLKVGSCAKCAHANGVYKSDDGPAYFTVLIVGHALIAPLLFAEFILTWPVLWSLGLILPLLVGTILLLLPRVKGAFVGLQWAINDLPQPAAVEP